MRLLHSLPYINGILFVLIIACIVGLVVNTMTFDSRHSVDAVKARAVVSEAPATEFEAVPFEEKESYLKRFTAKRLFRPLVKRQKKVEKVITVDDLTRDLLLIGVVKQDRPEAIIKNRRTRQTYMVKSGDPLGRLTVKAIEDDTVTLSFDGSTKKLFIQ